MKATRRQELRSNELMHGLQEAREFLRKYATHIIIGAVAIAAIFLVVFYSKESARQRLAEASQELSSLTATATTDDEARSAIKRIDELTGEVSNENFVVNALNMKSSIAMSRAHAADSGEPSRDFLDLAHQAYDRVRNDFPGRTLEVAAALYGLATIEMDLFVLDEDMKHKEKCKALLEELANNRQFNSLPYQDSALQRLNALDDVFVTIALADGPALPNQNLPPGVNVEGDVQIVPVSPEEVPEEIRQQASQRVQQGAQKRAGDPPQEGTPPAAPDTTDDPASEDGTAEPNAADEAAGSSDTSTDGTPE